ncbi:MAG: GIY-YIG nuclease family protein [Candidatus Hydrogenedentota bacterium]|nr:MAG: GIY-YIG nuclease family protein [Candidatus Hydrogenedentota bacterium]
MYYLYVIECKDDSLYTGICKNLEKRWKEHQNGIASKYTRAKGVKTLLCAWQISESRSEAQKAEFAFKACSKKQKLDFIYQNTLTFSYGKSYQKVKVSPNTFIQ